jgi:hypothetical protein
MKAKSLQQVVGPLHVPKNRSVSSLLGARRALVGRVGADVHDFAGISSSSALAGLPAVVVSG